MTPFSDSPRFLEKYLGPLEAQVMEIVWRRGPCTVREVWEELTQGRTLAYTTILTVLGRLTEKGLTVRDSAERSHRYRAAMAPDQLFAKISVEMVDEVVDRFGEVAIARFMEHMRRVEPERMRRLLEVLEQERDKPKD